MKTAILHGLFKLSLEKEKETKEEEVKLKEPVVKLRELQKNDRKGVLDLMNEFPEIFPSQYVNSRGFGGMLWFLNSARSGNADQIGSFVVEVDGRLAGHAAYCKDVRQFESGVYELKSVVIGQPFHKKGYGDKLVRHTLKKLEEMSAKCVYLITKKQGILYFSKFGFDIAGMHDYSINGSKSTKYVLSKCL